MNLTVFVAAVALGGHALLIVSVVRRAIAGPSLGALLARHALVPRWTRTRGFGLLVELAQFGTGVGGALSIVLLGPHGTVARVASLAAGAVYLGFAAYLTVLLARRGRVRCGCLSDRDRVGWPAIARACLFGVAGLAVSILGAHLDVMARLALVPAASLIAAAAVFLVSLADS